MCPYHVRRTRVRAHDRKLRSGKRAHVRAHSRLYNKVERSYEKKGYSKKRSEHIAGAVAYGPRSECD